MCTKAAALSHLLAMPTQRMSRKSLAAVICPSAPFLAPRLLRYAIPLTVTVASSQKSCYATKKSKSRKPKADHHSVAHTKGIPVVRKYDSRGSQLQGLLTHMSEACAQRDIAQIMELYPALLKSGTISGQTILAIVQALHAAVRHRTTTRDTFPFVEQICDDIRQRRVPAYPWAFVHLLGIFRDCKRYSEGLQFWNWLVEQDESCVSHQAYGAAIELMAYAGLKTLPALEALYNEALKRFPGVFAEYHLSPDAIISDRSAATTIAKIPTALLQGILAARILARDWRKSYLTLDTILRLYPTQTPTQFFRLFIKERPVGEAYTAFTIACRGGIEMQGPAITSLVTKLEKAMQYSSSLKSRVVILRAIANALYAHQETGGRLQALHISMFLRCFGQLLPEQREGKESDDETRQIRDTISLTAHEVLSSLFQAGLPPANDPFEALLSVYAKLRVPELFHNTLQEAKLVGSDYDPATMRAILGAAGTLGDAELVKQIWTNMVSKAETEGTPLGFKEWATFTKACRRADIRSYFDEQLERLSHTATDRVYYYASTRLNEEEPLPEPQKFESMDPADFAVEMEGLKQQVKNMEAVLMSGAPLQLSLSPFHMHIGPNAPSLTSSKHLRAIYDEFTTDPHQPPPPPPTQGSPVKIPMSSTGIPFDELRFRNWITVHELMAEAEAFDKEFQEGVDRAMAEGKPLDNAEFGQGFISGVVVPEGKEELREWIRRLRRVDKFKV